MNPVARRRAARPCLGGSESRSRLSGDIPRSAGFSLLQGMADGRLGRRAAGGQAGIRVGPVPRSLPPPHLLGDPPLRPGLRRRHGRVRAGVRSPARRRSATAPLLCRPDRSPCPLLHLARPRRPPPPDRLVPPPRRPASHLDGGRTLTTAATSHLRARLLGPAQPRRGV